MRALFFDWPDDPEIWRHPFQHMLGDDLLVAPVVKANADRWTIYLPAADWVDAWTGARVLGPAVVERPAPLDEMPIYVRTSADALLATVFRPAPP